jgi:kinesin family protein 2/24
MGLVATWLSGIGLSHAIPTFKAAGIVTPAALAELDVAHYEALGVKDPADRRKLFYLVQRIKMAQEEEPDGAQQEIDEIVSQSMVGSSASTNNNSSNSNNNTKLVLDEDDSLEEEEEEEVVEPTSSKQTRKSTASAGRKSLARSSTINEGVSNNATKENKQVNRPVKVPLARQRRTMPTTAAARTSKQTRKVAPNHEMEEEQPKDDDSDWEDESLIADDEASSSNRRSSRRLQEKRIQSVASGSSVGGDTGTEEETAESDIDRKATRRARGTSGSALGYSGDAETATSKKRQSSGRMRRASTSDLDADDESSTTPAHTRKSGMPPPRNRRYENSKLQGPTTRTGKQLSTIPSDSVAPMSPLTKMPVSRLDEDISQQQKMERKKKTDAVKQRLGRSLSSGDVSSSDTDKRSGSDTERRPRRSASTSGSDTEGQQNVARRRSRLSAGVASSGSDTEGQQNIRLKGRSRTSTGGIAKRNGGRSAIFVHGTADDTSWFGQIARLREENQSEHELFHTFDDDDDDEMRIRVIVRKRPMSSSEDSVSKEVDVIHPLDYGSYGRVLTYQPKTRVDLTRQVETIPFAYDNVFDESSSNKDIYDRTVSDLIPGVFEEGKWASVFAYGQTGSGKTFTMMGCNATGIRAGTSKANKENYGLYYMAALDVFAMANMEEFQHMSIGISLFEIYGGKLFDLLNSRKQVKCLEDHRGKVCFPGLSEHPVSDAHEVMQVIESGACNRSTGTTSKNADSSRSHAILQIHVRKSTGRKQNIEHGRLTFIDLAGSERGADTAKSSRATRLEGAEINTSLLALKEVIRALATGDSMSHIPFRGSKLTQVLKESFVGENARSVMVACIAPNMSNCEHTLNTLRYADRVKERNADSGALSASVSSIRGRASTSSKRLSRQSIAKEKSAQMVVKEEQYEEEWEEEAQFEESVDVRASFTPMSPESVMLAELLEATPKSIPRSAGSSTSRPPRQVEANDNGTAHELILTHRSVMSDMLRMCKDEMTLANNADADRDSIDAYLEELSGIHEKQCMMLTTLHEKLLEFRGSQGAGGMVADVSDDSFEDLRD